MHICDLLIVLADLGGTPRKAAPSGYCRTLWLLCAACVANMGGVTLAQDAKSPRQRTAVHWPPHAKATLGGFASRPQRLPEEGGRGRKSAGRERGAEGWAEGMRKRDGRGAEERVGPWIVLGCILAGCPRRPVGCSRSAHEAREISGVHIYIYYMHIYIYIYIHTYLHMPPTLSFEKKGQID